MRKTNELNGKFVLIFQIQSNLKMIFFFTLQNWISKMLLIEMKK